MATRTPYTSSASEVLTSANFEKMPKGEIAYAVVTSNQTGITDTFTDITGLSLEVTVGENRRLRLYAKVQVAADHDLGAILRVVKNGSEFDRIARIQLLTSEQGMLVGWTEDNPDSGTHTYKLQAATATNGDTMSVQASSTAPIALARFSIDDIGPAFS